MNHTEPSIRATLDGGFLESPQLCSLQAMATVAFKLSVTQVVANADIMKRLELGSPQPILACDFG
jgi:hypothetical protein